ncbi:hypothetical protein GCM10010250_04570 [Streptomyces althioticus]|nr:hypothetical protein GCM10010250_04570 [Streptomyces althioticus]
MRTVGGLDGRTGLGVGLRGHAPERRRRRWTSDIGGVSAVRGFPRQVVDKGGDLGRGEWPGE